MIILLIGIFLISYYFAHIKNECLKEPLVYGAKQMKEKYGYEFTGWGMFEVPKNYNSPLVTFNSTALTISKKN